MALTSGTRLGPYEIVAPLGAGGMGEVYRARDTKLNRDVALKILPDAFATDADRLTRFRREAQVLASLNHPNIAQIYGFEDSGRTHALVMELVEGPTLADRIAHGPIAPADVIPIAKQIAEALEAAHEAGIVHRDLKPANVKVRDDGTVKVLDFGLAKAMDPFSGVGATPASPLQDSPTMTSPARLRQGYGEAGTEIGMIIGTAAYMSPEQAKGRVVDKRADIWAFGVVLFEMLSGRALFQGDSVAETLGFVATRDPDWSTLPATTPSSVRRLLARCLARDPKVRLRDIGEARLLLAEPADSSRAVATPRRSPLAPILGAALVVSLVALGASMFSGGGPIEGTPLRLAVTFAEDGNPQKGQPLPSLAISPDGRTLVYTAAGGRERSQLWRRDLGALAPEPMSGTGPREGTGGTNGSIARQVFFSPDGKSIGFVHGNFIRTMPLALGAATDVCEVLDGVRGATWTEGQEIVYASTVGKPGLWRVPASGGTPVRVADGEFFHPDALPGGRAVIVSTTNPTAERSSGELTIVAVTLATGAVTKVLDGGTYVRYVPTGHLVFARDGALVAAPFDASRLTAGEGRTRLVSDLWMDPAVPSGNYAVSAAGTLVYAPGSPDDFKRSLVAIDGDTAKPLSQDQRYFAYARMSPKGRFVAVVERAWRDRVLIFDTVRQAFSRLTASSTDSESRPVWSRDGTQVAFSVDGGAKPGLYVAPIDGSAPPKHLYASADGHLPLSFTAEGGVLIEVRRAETGYDIMAVSLDGSRAVRPVLQTTVDERDAVVSPDGRAIAYRSWRTGGPEIWVSDFPSMKGAVQVSLRGGQTPLWAPNSQRVFFRAVGRQVWAADVSRRSAGEIPPAVAVATFPTPYPTAFVDVMPDGRFLGIDGPAAGGTPELRVIVNWFQELGAKVPR